MAARSHVGPDASQQAVRVQVSQEVRYGVYANFAVVSHSGHEFTLDLCQVQPEEAQTEYVAADLVARVHLPPTLIPSLMRALEANLGAYERQFGTVRDVNPLEPRE